MHSARKEYKEQVDPYLVERIQPRGGIVFRDEKVIETGTGLETCIHVIKLPHNVEDHWLMDICNIDNTITTIDIHTEDAFEVKKNLNRSIGEQQSRYANAQTKEEQIDAETKYQEMDALLRELTTMGEVLKSVHIRIFAYARTRKELEDHCKEIMTQLESNSYISAVFLNENKEEWMSMWETFDEQNARPFAVHGIPLQTEIIAAGDPFHFSSLSDENGDYLGNTSCGGNVIFDEFKLTDKRMYYNAVVVGEMGAGKSTLLKKRFLARAVRGDYVRTFDISGEFTELTRSLGGKIIKPDGSSGMLNPLEILASGENERINYSRHITKVMTIYRFLVPSATNENLNTFQKLLVDLYTAFGFDIYSDQKEFHVTGRPAADYPTFSDMLLLITEKIKNIVSGEHTEMEKVILSQELTELNSIRMVIENIVTAYGHIFDGHTSIDNILDEQIVTFDISDLKNMEASVFDAQLFNMLSLCWDNCVKNGSLMKEQYDKNRIRWEDIVRFLILIDESHRWINTSKMQAVDLVTVYMREARKYFGGIFLASQSIRDFVPEGSSDDSINRIKTIFELTQYKFIFRQNSNVLPMIDKIFDGVLTDSQRAQIPRLTKGSTILNMSSDTSLQFKVYLSAREKEIFSGGA